MEIRDLLEGEFAKIKVKMTAKGVRREDGKTAAEIEREVAKAKEERSGAE
jgi:hypothetical protein